MSMNDISPNFRLGKLVSPPGIPLLLVGLTTGLVMGGLELPHSPDKATGVGLSWFIGVSIGMWIGVEVGALSVSLLARFFREVLRQAEEIKERVEKQTGINVDAARRPKSTLYRLWGVILFVDAVLYPILIMVTAALGTVLAIGYGAGVGLSPVVPLITIFGALSTIISLSVMAATLPYLYWRLHRIKKRIERAASTPPSLGPLGNGHGVDSALRNTERFFTLIGRHGMRA